MLQWTNTNARSAFIRAAAGLLALGAFAAPAMAEFGEPGATSVRERIIGQLVAATGTPEPAAGDMIGAFFDTDKLCGRFVFTGTAIRWWLKSFLPRSTTSTRTRSASP